METRDAIMARRSIRAYQDRPVGDEDLRDILEAGTAAPSGVNLQPWFFVALRSREQLDRLAEVMDRVSARIEPDLQSRFGKHPEVVAETTRFVRKLGGAPVCILAFWYKPDYENKADAVTLSIAAAMENILLAAADKGLGSCWLTAPAEAGVGDELRDLFAPGKGPLAAMLTLGYPDQRPKAPPRKEGRYLIL